MANKSDETLRTDCRLLETNVLTLFIAIVGHRSRVTLITGGDCTVGANASVTDTQLLAKSLLSVNYLHFFSRVLFTTQALVTKYVNKYVSSEDSLPMITIGQ